MSARPRPVTATVTKPEWMKAEYAYRPYTHSLDSSGSTDSLISCLDHDSYESSADDEQELHYEKPSSPPRVNVTFDADDEELKNVSKNKTKVVRKTAFCDIENESMLSPWEKWLVQKAQEERQQKQEILLKKKEEKLKKEIVEQKKIISLEKAKVKREEWMKKKEYEQKLRAQQQQQHLRAKKEIEEAKKQRIQEKSEEKFQEWTKKKKEETRKTKLEEKKRKEEEEKQRLERKEIAEKKYEEWVKLAEHRPKSAPPPQKDTKLKGGISQDYPAPSFYNPLPWQPIHIPTYKEDQKKPKTKKKKKYVWNPNKYF